MGFSDLFSRGPRRRRSYYGAQSDYSDLSSTAYQAANLAGSSNQSTVLGTAAAATALNSKRNSYYGSLGNGNVQASNLRTMSMTSSYRRPPRASARAYPGRTMSLQSYNGNRYIPRSNSLSSNSLRPRRANSLLSQNSAGSVGTTTTTTTTTTRRVMDPSGAQQTSVTKTTKEQDYTGRTRSITKTTIERRGDLEIVHTTVVKPASGTNGTIDEEDELAGIEEEFDQDFTDGEILESGVGQSPRFHQRQVSDVSQRSNQRSLQPRRVSDYSIQQGSPLLSPPRKTTSVSPRFVPEGEDENEHPKEAAESPSVSQSTSVDRLAPLAGSSSAPAEPIHTQLVHKPLQPATVLTEPLHPESALQPEASKLMQPILFASPAPTHDYRQLADSQTVHMPPSPASSPRKSILKNSPSLPASPVMMKETFSLTSSEHSKEMYVDAKETEKKVHIPDEYQEPPAGRKPLQKHRPTAEEMYAQAYKVAQERVYGAKNAAAVGASADVDQATQRNTLLNAGGRAPLLQFSGSRKTTIPAETAEQVAAYRPSSTGLAVYSLRDMPNERQLRKIRKQQAKEEARVVKEREAERKRAQKEAKKQREEETKKLQEMRKSSDPVSVKIFTSSAPEEKPKKKKHMFMWKRRKNKEDDSLESAPGRTPENTPKSRRVRSLDNTPLSAPLDTPSTHVEHSPAKRIVSEPVQPMNPPQTPVREEKLSQPSPGLGISKTVEAPVTPEAPSSEAPETGTEKPPHTAQPESESPDPLYTMAGEMPSSHSPRATDTRESAGSSETLNNNSVGQEEDRPDQSKPQQPVSTLLPDPPKYAGRHRKREESEFGKKFKKFFDL